MNRCWIQTYTGCKFWPLNPRPKDIYIEDIAHGLALKCRFNGHCKEFYSVAQHCVVMSWESFDCSPAWRLLHDAAEAYLPDMPTPIKNNIPGYSVIERKILEAVSIKFGLDFNEIHKVKTADLVMLSTEKRDLMGPEPDSWNLLYPPLDSYINPWSWQESEQKFLERYGQLIEARLVNG